MTDRLKGLLIIFEQDIREDEAQQFMELFKLVRGVVDVKTVKAESHLEYEIAQSRIRRELLDKWYQIAYGKDSE